MKNRHKDLIKLYEPWKPKQYKDGSMFYLSNAQRESMIEAMEEFIKRHKKEN